MIDQYVDLARALCVAPHGERGALIGAAAQRLGVSPQTVRAKLAPLMPRQTRRPRCDRGQITLTEAEAQTIAAAIESSRRQTGTGQMSIESAVAMLRAAGAIEAGRVDPETGEFRALSIRHIERGLAHWNCHPHQLAQTEPASRLASEHPNHIWQVDASLSAQYYLTDRGLAPLKKEQHYSGKPVELERISRQRLWRYVVTDHASGALELIYVLGAESAANLIRSLMHAMTRRPESTLYGVPRVLMTDPGSAMTAAPTRAFLRALGVDLLINRVGNARGKGQVEQAHHMVETHFEALLRFAPPVASLEQLNALAARWCRDWSATRTHTRHGMTRRDAWLQITPEQLVLAPALDVLATLPQSEPLTLTVRDGAVRYAGQRWSVVGIPGLRQGQKVQAVRNALDPDSLRILRSEDGREVHYLAARIERDSWGFERTAAQLGTYRPLPDTAVDAQRKAIDRLAMGASTDEEAAAKRKARTVPLAGRIADPFAGMTTAVPVLPRAGQASTVQPLPERVPEAPAALIRPAYTEPALGHVQMAQRLRSLLGERGITWTAEHYARMVALWPNGCAESALPGALPKLLQPALRAVGGAA